MEAGLETLFDDVINVLKVNENTLHLVLIELSCICHKKCNILTGQVQQSESQIPVLLDSIIDMNTLYSKDGASTPSLGLCFWGEDKQFVVFNKSCKKLETTIKRLHIWTYLTAHLQILLNMQPLGTKFQKANLCISFNPIELTKEQNSILKHYVGCFQIIKRTFFYMETNFI